jgi:hypothetical protein
MTEPDDDSEDRSEGNPFAADDEEKGDGDTEIRSMGEMKLQTGFIRECEGLSN